MKRQVRLLLLLVLLLGAVVPGKAGPGAGAGSVTADNSKLASTATDVNYIYTEALHLGPSANWQIDGIVYFYGKSIRIAPGATLSGTGKIVLMDPAENPFWEDMTAGATVIDGNDGNFIDLNVELRNPSGATLSNIADIGYSADGANNSLKIGKDLLLNVNGAHITLSSATTSDLVFDSDATISGYTQDRMVVTGGTVSHVVKENYTGAFVFPVGIAAGDYTPAQLTNTTANTMHVSVLDYATSASTEAGTDGMQRTWNIYAGSASGNTLVALQHNVSTELAGFNTTSNFVTRYGAAAANATGNSGSASSTPWQSNSLLAAVKSPATVAFTSSALGMSNFSINSLAYTTFATSASAEEAYFSKSSNLSSPLGITATVPDLRPSITFTGGSTNFAVGASKTLTFRISNIVFNSTTTGAVTFRIFRPTVATGMTFTLNATPEWDVVTNTLYYDLTLKSGLSITSTTTTGFKEVTGVLARLSGAAGAGAGQIAFSTSIRAGGGETNTTNNTASVTFTKLANPNL